VEVCVGMDLRICSGEECPAGELDFLIVAALGVVRGVALGVGAVSGAAVAVDVLEVRGAVLGVDREVEQAAAATGLGGVGGWVAATAAANGCALGRAACSPGLFSYRLEDAAEGNAFDGDGVFEASAAGAADIAVVAVVAVVVVVVVSLTTVAAVSFGAVAVAVAVANRERGATHDDDGDNVCRCWPFVTILDGHGCCVVEDTPPPC